VPDLPGLARAVERLVHSLAPGVVTRVTVAVPPPVPAPVPVGSVTGGHTPDDPDADPSGRTALAEGLWFDRASRTLEAEGRRLTLTRREFELLAYLERRRGVAVSRRELMTHVWGGGYLAGDRTIDVHIRRLRVKLGRHRDRIITLRGYGYRFD
jgi:DNA-binding response OmpR family regulator